MTAQSLERLIESLKRKRPFLINCITLDMNTAAAKRKLAAIEIKIEKAQESLIKVYLS